MKNFILTIVGVATLLIALTLNFRHALDDYGVTKNKLHMEVLAQTNDSGGDSSGGGTSGGDSSGGGTSGGGTSGEGSNNPPSNNSKIVLTAAGSTTVKQDSFGGYVEFGGNKKYTNYTVGLIVRISVESCTYSPNSNCDYSITGTIRITFP